MRKKLLAAIMSAAMVACASPVIALAEPVVDVETETTTEGEDVTEEALKEAALVAEPAPVSGPGVDVQADAITDQASLEAAIAKGGTVDMKGQTIELTSPLTVSTSVEIANGTLTSGTGISGNLVTLLNGIDVTLTNVKINTAAGNKHALHAWGTNLTVNGLTIDHTNATNGAPIVINNGATARFSGSVDLTLGTTSWYGVNVDSATADFSGAALNVNGAAGTQSVVCIDNASSEAVTGVNLTEVVTASDGGSGAQQIAYVADANLPQFVEQKTAAGADIETITLNTDVELAAPLYLGEAMTVNGKGFSFIGTSALGKENVVTIMANDVALANVTIKTDTANKSALHIYMSNATLSNITLDNTNTAGGAGMIVNGGTVSVYDGLNILLGENSWGGINVDGKNGASAVVFAQGSKVTVQDGSGKGLDAIYIENAGQNTVTVEGAEAAGLVKDADGNYIVKTETKPGEDNKPADDNKKDDKKDGASPKTGDSSALLIALMALAVSGVAATVVIRKRNEMSR